MTFSITKRDRQIDIETMMADERVLKAFDDTAEAMAIDERMRPVWPECPQDQMFILLDGWKAAMIAARDYKQGALSAAMFRARLAMLAGGIERAMVNLDDQGAD
jgi:hypothetical protein